MRIDSNLTYDEHISKLSSSFLYKLSRINRIKHLPDRKTLILVVNAFVFTYRLFYFSTVWSNPSKKNTRKLQLIQNFACRSILGLQKFEYFSKALKSFGWHNVCDKLFLNDLVMVHKCINNLAPPYLSTLFNTRSRVSKRSNRNESDLDLLECRLATGQHPFTFLGSKGFNTLPKDIKSIKDPKAFRCKVSADLNTKD